MHALLLLISLTLQGKVVFEDSGEPVANAEVAVLGRPGAAFTDAEGRFTFTPAPSLPFEILVILPGERYMKPVLIESLPDEGSLVIPVAPLVQESVTVTAGAAPDIDSSPASGNTLLSRTDIEVRQPVNLVQALENVPGVSKVSEGQAAVPALRGLARGRTLILIDDARVTAERRAGPSATFLDPFLLEGIQVSRGPGSVAYGSDAFGGVIHARTRRPVPGTPWALRFLGTIGAGAPQQRVGAEVSRGFAEGGILFQGHYRNFDDYRSPEGTVPNSSAEGHGFLGRWDQVVGPGHLSVGFQSDHGRDIGRPRTNSNRTRFYYPIEDSERFTASYALGSRLGLDRLSVSTFLGSYRIMTDQDSFATSSTPRHIERADVDASDFHVRAKADKTVSGAQISFGLDVNGRMEKYAVRQDRAEVLGVAALLVAVVGTAIAAPAAIRSALNKSEKKRIAKIANQQITKRAPGLSVAGAGTANSANLAQAVQNGAIGTAQMANGIPAASAYTTSQSIPNNTTTDLVLDNEHYDTANMHSNATAPSVTWQLLPTVTSPSRRSNTGLSFCSAS